MKIYWAMQPQVTWIRELVTTSRCEKFRFRATSHRVFCEPIVLSDVDLQAGLLMRRGELIRRSNSFSLAIDNLCFLFTVGLAQ